ncbi:MAG: leucine-rich repeat protein, partial [Clostridia bacterium]|nr:leucine-rich repeat protein [Clostridia bacterium]
AFENRTFKCSGTGKQIHAKLDLNGGSITKQFNNTDDNVWDYVQYAKEAGAMLAMDVYAKFTVSNGSDPHCHMSTTWIGSNSDENFKWPTGEKDFEIASGTKYTYYIDPNDIPLGSNSFTVRFNTYDQEKYGNRDFNSDTVIYLTAPYLVDVKHPDKTTTTTATDITTPTTTTRPSAFPSYNVSGKTRFTVGNVTCNPNETIKVPINISDNEGLYNAKFSVRFNPDDLHYIGCTNGEVFDNISINEEDIRDGIVHINLNQFNGNATKNGAVAYLEFEVPVDEGSYTISFAGSSYDPADFFNFDGEVVSCSFAAGKISVDEPDYDYKILQNGTVEIKIYTGDATKLEIPATIGDKVVSSIADSAFMWCDSLTSVVIPEGVTTIGEFAFAGCPSLTSVTIPNSVQTLGTSSFDDCRKDLSIVCGCSNEVVKDFAAEKDIPITSTIHTEVIDKAVAPTCTETGLTQGKHCSACNEVFIKQEVIDALGHEEVVDKAVESTCTETGLTQGKHCSVCNEVLVKQEVIDALGHEFENYASNEDATCTENGTETAKCERCAVTDTREDDDSALGHKYSTEWSTDKKATCTETGIMSRHCVRYDECGSKTEEITIPKTKHI